MSLVVSDSGPVHYLVLCEAIHVVEQIFGDLVIPGSVREELTQPQTPPVVRHWIQTLPKWASVRNPQTTDPSRQLGRGERDAIALARELGASLLIDDRVGRRVAAERGLSVTGTIGILELAAERGFLDLAQAFQKLVHTNFRIDADVVRHALERDAARRKAPPAA